jgi:hypothetical protein
MSSKASRGVNNKPNEDRQSRLRLLDDQDDSTAGDAALDAAEGADRGRWR